MKTIQQLLDDASTCSQHPEMCMDDRGNEPALRECVRINVAEPLMKEIERLTARLQSIANMPEYDQDDAHRLRGMARGIFSQNRDIQT